MFDILRQKILRLGRDEDGAALVITLALLMFLYASCAGVFAIGQSVKDRIHLQNACDAAAYSAAVVQADTLSRIATINRAMSWTYVSMTRRQMDYIVWKWLDHTWRHYEQDRNVAKISGNPGAHGHVCWYIGSDPASVTGVSGKEKVNLNGSRYPYCVESPLPGDITVKKECKDEFLGKHLTGASFYCPGDSIGEGKLKDNLDADFDNIEQMGIAENNLIEDLPTRMYNAAKEVLHANLSRDKWTQCRWFIERGNDYFGDLKAEDEERFMGFADIDIETKDQHFGNGSGDGEWFPLVEKSKKGIQRKYNKTSKKLFSEWSWWAKKWACTPYGCTFVYNGDCPHSCPSCGEGKCDRCEREGMTIYHAKLSAAHLHDRFYDGERALPKVLSENYFGPAGTITVGLAKYNENPWFGTLKRVVEYVENGAVLFGIHGAFNPFVEWSWALSSAKAGYKFLDQWDDFEVDEEDFDFNDARAYRVSWEDNQTWNLCQSDWDAVFVPVRSNWLGVAEDGSWGEEDSSTLLDGEWEPLGADSASSEFAVHNIKGLPRMHNSGRVDGTLQLGRLKDLFFH